MPPTKVLKLKPIVITAILSNKILLLLGIGNGDGSDLFFTVGNYDGLLGRF